MDTKFQPLPPFDINVSPYNGEVVLLSVYSGLVTGWYAEQYKDIQNVFVVLEGQLVITPEAVNGWRPLDETTDSI